MAHLQYLEQTVQLTLQAVLEELVSKQPEDPIHYLADHFDREIKPGREPLLIAADLLCDLKSLSQQVLDSTIYKVYSQLSESEDDCLTAGVLGSEVNRLIRQTCCDLDTSVGEALLRKLRVHDNGTVLFPTFKSRMNVCVLLLDFLRTIVQLFETLDSCSNGTILRQTGEDLLSRLSAALSVSLDVRQNVKQTESLLKSLQVEKKYGTDTDVNAHSIVNEKAAVQCSGDDDGTLSSREFQQLAARVFINHLPSNLHGY